MRILVLPSLCAALVGCAYRGAKITEGVDLAAGIDLPAAEGVAKFTALNYLSGFRLAVDRNARLTCDYSVAESNAYFGVIRTSTRKTVRAKVDPCEVAPASPVAAAQAASPCTNGACSP